MAGSLNENKPPKQLPDSEAPLATITAEQTLELIDRRKFTQDELETERRRFPRAAFRGIERIRPIRMADSQSPTSFAR